MPRKPRELINGGWKPGTGDDSDNDDVEVSTDHLPNAPVRKGLLLRPFPGRSWGQLFKLPLHHSPWPYLEPEIRKIESLLPQPFSQETIDDVILAARKYIRVALLRREGNADPKSEIARVRKSLAEAIAALEGLSLEARNHLVKNWGPVNSNDVLPGNTSELKHALAKFEFRLRLMKDQPPKSRRGASTKNHEAWLAWRIRETFAAAHGGKLPARRFPSFRRSCVEPLKYFGLPETLSDDTWDDKLRKPRDKSTQKG
jgi:hypothetical protein